MCSGATEKFLCLAALYLYIFICFNYTNCMSSKNRTYALIFFVLLAYFLLRTVNLTGLPIFNDESTYIRYGIHQLNEPTHQPFSLLIGKEPLDPYLYAFVGTMIGNLLVGGRIVTMVWGLLTLIGLYLFTNELLGKRAALFASLLYVITPYTVFFDRLALLDSSVSTIAVWSLFLTQKLLHKAQWRYAIALGVVAGIGLWTKTSTLFYLFLPLISYIIFYFTQGDKRFNKAKQFATAVIVSLLIFIPLYTNQFYAIHMQLLSQYTYPLGSIFTFPVAVWWDNLTGIVEWLFFYLTPPLFLLALGSLIYFTKRKKLWFVFLWFYLPLVYEILYAKLFTSRHVLLLTVPLLILAGYGLSLLWQRKKIFGAAVGIIIFLWSLYDCGILVTNPQQYPSLFIEKAATDADQYVHGYPSGYGVLEAINYVQQQAASQRIIVIIRNDHGNPEDAVVAYLDYKPNIILLPLGNPSAAIDSVFKQVGTSIPVYFVARGNNNGGLEKYFGEKKIFTKPNDQDFVDVVKLQPLRQ